MAINLWELGEQPTSFNPLPIGANNFVVLSLYQEYEITFKAKSSTNSILRVTSWNAKNDFQQDITLTSDFKEYKFSWFESENGRFYFRDVNATGDIAIQDIQLVRKPLGKATINGIDGFLSGKWKFDSNTIVIDDETIKMTVSENKGPDGTLLLNSNSLFVDVLPNTHYMLYASEFEGRLVVRELNNNDVTINSIFVFPLFKTNINTKRIRVDLDNTSKIGTFFFKKPMLVLGDQVVPYEPKRGEKMVEPVPKKNLLPPRVTFTSSRAEHLDDYSMRWWIGNSYSFWVRTEVGKKYTFSVETDGVWMAQGTNAVDDFTNSTTYEAHITDTITFTATKPHLKISNISNHPDSANGGKYFAENWMFYEGSQQESFEPFAVQVNKHAKRNPTAKRSQHVKRLLFAKR